jgi:hypothetical protein
MCWKIFGLFLHLGKEFLHMALAPIGSEFAREGTVEE